MQVSVIVTPSFDEGRDRAPLQVEHRGGLAQHAGLGEIGAARVGDGRNAHAALAVAAAASASSQRTPASPRLSVSAMMCACVTGTKSAAPKKSPTAIWCAQRLLRNRAVLAGENLLLFVVQFHCVQSIVAPDSRTALPHLASSRRWNSAKSSPAQDLSAPRRAARACRGTRRRAPRAAIASASAVARSSGNRAGANTPHHAVVSKSG